jgi:type II secretory pathway pseudopilin PulG
MHTPRTTFRRNTEIPHCVRDDKGGGQRYSGRSEAQRPVGPSCHPERSEGSRGGFTLVEVALSVVVVAVGVLAAFALIGTGLDSSAKAVSETRAAIFADDVFNSLRTRNEQAIEAGSAAWLTFWTGFSSGGIQLPVAGGPLWQYEVSYPGGPWSPPSTNYVRVWGAGGPHTAVFTNFDLRLSALTGVVNHSLRYKIKVDPVIMVVSYPPVSPTVVWTNRKMRVRMNIWEGQYGVTPLDKALTFSTEYPMSGGL